MPTLEKKKSSASAMKSKTKKVLGKVAAKITAKDGVKLKGAGKNGFFNGVKGAVKAGAKAVSKAYSKAERQVEGKLKGKLDATMKAVGKGKRTYYFGGGKADGNKEMKNLLGGKGANLAEMANIGLPVPPGFTITTEVCTEFYANGKKLPKRWTPTCAP